MERVLTKYRFQSPKITQPLRFIIVSDLHNEPWDDLLPRLQGYDALLMPGDLYDRYRQKGDTGLAFAAAAAKVLPVFFSPGNHDLHQPHPEDFLRAVAATGSAVLDRAWLPFGGITLGGWLGGGNAARDPFPHEFAALSGFKLLLCHKPDQAVKFVLKENIDLILSGHAHGGQIRVNDRGLYAPGQGFLPKYTKGWVKDRLLITTGAGNPARMPRTGNQPEIVELILENQKTEEEPACAK